MGACNSREITAASAAPGYYYASTEEARVVLADGALRRFPGGTTRASRALKLAAAGGAWFLCSADGLEPGTAATAVGPDEDLHPGQLYFVLPAAMRRRPLRAEEMAALAVRASAALAGDVGGALVFPEHHQVGDDHSDAAAGVEGGRGGDDVSRSVKEGRRRSRRMGGSRGRDFVPDLDAIAE